MGQAPRLLLCLPALEELSAQGFLVPGGQGRRLGEAVLAWRSWLPLGHSKLGREAARGHFSPWEGHLPAPLLCEWAGLSFPLHICKPVVCLFFPSSPLSYPPSPPILRTHSPWIPGNGWCNFVTKCPGSLCVGFMLLCPSAPPRCPPWLGRVTENHGLPGCQLGLSSDHGASGGSPALCGRARRPEGVRLQAGRAHPHTHLPSEEEEKGGYSSSEP